jgi:proteic killer suppression protein
MDVYAGDKKLRSAIDDENVAKRHYGADMAKKLTLRVAALRAAVSLADFWPPKSGPERCHELKGGLEGVFSCDLKQPYRLLFKPIGADVLQDRSNELLRWQSIRAVEVLTIEDTHE